VVPADGGRRFRLTRDEELAAGLTRLAAERAEAALEGLRAGVTGEAGAAEAVHGARKDLKKLRTVLRLLRKALGKTRSARAGARFRDAGRALAEARDAAVKLRTLEALEEYADGLPDGAVEAWRKILARDREAAVDTPRSEALATEAIAEIAAGLEEVRNWAVSGDSWKTIVASLQRTYRRGRKAKKAAPSGSEEDLHEWRKRAKDLWYALRIFSDAWPAPLEATAEQAHQLSELLGDHHDLAILRADLRRRNLGEMEAQVLTAAIERRQEELAEAAAALGRRLYAEPPREFSRRLRRYRDAWRG
jgi:CHAD domain-containing protein